MFSNYFCFSLHIRGQQRKMTWASLKLCIIISVFVKKKNDSSFDINVSLEDIKARKYVYELYSVKHTYNEHAYNELLLSHIYSPM